MFYFGMAHLGMKYNEVLYSPFGWLLDLIECHQQYNRVKKPYKEKFIDDIIPFGI